MTSDKNVLKVRIYGAEYSIRGHADANYIKAVAEYLDQKMHDVDSNIRVDSSIKVAILASLNITDELFRERAENKRIKQQFEDTIKRLNQRIEKNISKESK